MAAEQDGTPACAWNARLYEEKHAFVWKAGASLVELLAPQPGEHILDLGCGTGHLTSQIAQAGARVLGVDLSPAMIEQARRNQPSLAFEVADARSLPFTAQFDAVFSNAVLHWVHEADVVARRVREALKPGGRFVVELGGAGNVQAIVAALHDALTKAGVTSLPRPWYYPSVGEYAGLLEREGLEVTLALLFDRPTLLDGPEGMRHWIEMFGGAFLAHISVNEQQQFIGQVEAALRPQLYREGQWFADYRRLRVVARREG